MVVYIDRTKIGKKIKRGVTPKGVALVYTKMGLTQSFFELGPPNFAW